MEKNTEDLEPGMRVSAEVLNEAGEVLVAAETELTVEHIEAITQANVKTVVIEVSAEAEGETEVVDEAPKEPSLLDEAKQEVERRFVLVDLKNKVMRKIFDEVVLLEALSLGYDPEAEKLAADEKAAEAKAAAEAALNKSKKPDTEKEEDAEEGAEAAEAAEGDSGDSTDATEGEATDK